jgi:glycine betaine/choline ABC-type transport system substrate-binding protein
MTKVRIGCKNFTEQLILGEIMAHMIEAGSDLGVERLFNLGGTMICHGALVNGEIDLYAEYTGTGLTAILKEPVISDPEKALLHVRRKYLNRFNARWLMPFGFNNTYAITVREEDGKKYGWKRVSDIAEAASGLRAGFTAEFAERPDGYPGLRRAYGIKFGEVRDLDPSIMYEAITQREVDVICAFATDGRIAAYKLSPLQDDLQYFPPYYAAPVVRVKILEDHPELADILSSLENLLDDRTMQRLNFEVDGNKQSPAQVAKKFLKSKGLL